MPRFDYFRTSCPSYKPPFTRGAFDLFFGLVIPGSKACAFQHEPDIRTECECLFVPASLFMYLSAPPSPPSNSTTEISLQLSRLLRNASALTAQPAIPNLPQNPRMSGLTLDNTHRQHKERVERPRAKITRMQRGTTDSMAPIDRQRLTPLVSELSVASRY